MSVLDLRFHLALQNEIGWREKSRRIIVYSSNSLFHLAGSGLVGSFITCNPYCDDKLFQLFRSQYFMYISVIYIVN